MTAFNTLQDGSYGSVTRANYDFDSQLWHQHESYLRRYNSPTKHLRRHPPTVDVTIYSVDYPLVISNETKHISICWITGKGTKNSPRLSVRRHVLHVRPSLRHSVTKVLIYLRTIVDCQFKPSCTPTHTKPTFLRAPKTVAFVVSISSRFYTPPHPLPLLHKEGRVGASVNFRF